MNSVSGLDHTLTCTVTVVNGVQSDLVMISWTGPSSLSSSPRVTISDQTNNGVVYTRTVTFSPLLNGDGGQYTCSVSVDGFDEANNSNSTTIMVNGMCRYNIPHFVTHCMYISKSVLNPLNKRVCNPIRYQYYRQTSNIHSIHCYYVISHAECRPLLHCIARH